MNCEQVAPYLPGIADGELGADTIQWIEVHLGGCRNCRAEAERFSALASGLRGLSSRAIEPPAFLPDAILERVHAEQRRRFVPVPAMIPAELVRIVQDNRDAIASAGALIAAAGAAYALWRTVRRVRPGLRPAAS